MTCATCGSDAFDGSQLVNGEPLCDTCWVAFRDGISIEEARIEVEDGAAFWTQRFGRAAGEKCTCGTVDHLTLTTGPRGYAARIELDVKHDTSCPLGPPVFDWPPVGEDARARIFGYHGDRYHVARLVELLREHLHEREVMET